MKDENVLLIPPPAVTIIPKAPNLLVGVVQVIVVSLTTIILLATFIPNLTSLAPVKFVPVIVTEFPPSVVPDDGEILVTTGGVI